MNVERYRTQYPQRGRALSHFFLRSLQFTQTTRFDVSVGMMNGKYATEGPKELYLDQAGQIRLTWLKLEQGAMLSQRRHSGADKWTSWSKKDLSKSDRVGPETFFFDSVGRLWGLFESIQPHRVLCESCRPPMECRREWIANTLKEISITDPLHFVER